MRALCTIALAPFCLGVAAPAQAQAPLGSSDFTVAKVHDGMDSLAVIQTVGRPDSVQTDTSEMGTYSHWYYRSLDVVFNRRGTVFGLRVIGHGVRTSRGLAVGDAAARVRVLYGVPGDTTGGDWWYRDCADSTNYHGIWVTVARGVVSTVYIGWMAAE